VQSLTVQSWQRPDNRDLEILDQLIDRSARFVEFKLNA
jgi:hypothetical protein